MPESNKLHLHHVVCWVIFLLAPSSVKAKPRPNIVIHLADDLGIGDVGCYGNRTLNTPNIDRLAKEGIKLTHHLAAASVCTPSRAALLTGRYPVRYGLVPGSSAVINSAASTAGLLPSEVTFAELAKDAGYKTALIGKWHLGLYNVFREPIYHPLNQGFDYFYGIPLTLVSDFGEEEDSMALYIFPNIYKNMFTKYGIAVASLLCLLKIGAIRARTFLCLLLFCSLCVLYLYIESANVVFLSSILMRDYTVIEKPIRLRGLTQRFANEGKEFLQRAADSGQPFLLFMSWGHTHTFLSPSRKFEGRTRHGRYGDCVEELDWGIGEINSALEDLNLADNTFVYFTSDHGADLHERGTAGQIDGGYNGIYKGSKGHASVDGAFRTPGVMRLPGRIKPQTVSDLATSHLDILPLIAHLTGTTPPTDRPIDGKDIRGILEDKPGAISPHEFLFHYHLNEISAVRYMSRDDQRTWKVAFWLPDYLPGTMTCKNDNFCRPDSGVRLELPVLFDLTSDPAEEHPIRKGEHPLYDKIVSIVSEAVSRHEATIEPVASQLSFFRIRSLPHLLSCCHFPVCSCNESRYSDADLA